MAWCCCWNLSAFFKICFCFGLLCNKSLNDLSLGEQWILFLSSLRTGSPFGLFQDLLLNGARAGERGRVYNGPCTIWVLPPFPFDWSVKLIEMNQSQLKRKWPCRTRRLSNFWYMCTCLHVSTVGCPETPKKTFWRKAGRKPLDL